MAATSNLTLLLKVIEQEKELFWRNNAGVTDEERQQMWAAETDRFRPLLGTMPPDDTSLAHTTSRTSATPSMERRHTV